MPIPYEPMLCTPQLEMYLTKFSDKWIAEVKYDGERIIAERNVGHIYLWTRRHKEVSAKFPEVVTALSKALPRTDWIIDGEMTVRGGFEKILKRNTLDSIAIKVLSRDNPARLNVFDVLKVGEMLMVNNATLDERREILSPMVTVNDNVKLAHSVKGTRARQLFDMVTSADGEGVVVKNLKSKYLPGVRSPQWFKVKKQETVDVEVIGATKSDALPFGSLVLARAGKFFGKVGTGFTDLQRVGILGELYLHPDSEDFARWGVPPEVKREMIRVCSPLPAEIKMMEHASTGKPRHPVWVRWRE